MTLAAWSRLWVVAAGFLCIAAAGGFTACGAEGDAGIEEESAELELELDPDLVGAWTGMIEGVHLGRRMTSEIVFELVEGGVLHVDPSDLPFRPIRDGAWGVAGAEFHASGRDVLGSRVVFSAPRSTDALTGTWESGGDRGAFSIAREEPAP